MGRTVIPYSIQIERVRKRFKEFTDGLRKEDREIFRQLMVHARYHVQAGVMASFPDPSDPVFMSILIEMQKELNRQKTEIERLKETVAGLKENTE